MTKLPCSHNWGVDWLSNLKQTNTCANNTDISGVCGVDAADSAQAMLLTEDQRASPAPFSRDAPH